MAAPNEKKPGRTLALIHELATGDLSRSDIARKYEISRSAVSNFARRHQPEIDKIQEELTERMNNLYIRDIEWRLAEYQHDAQMLKGKKNPAAVRARVMLLKQAAEELGQIPGRTSVVVIPVQHVIEGVDMKELT